jgi:CubicO group peptidase (beta-lactamase class C family)
MPSFKSIHIKFLILINFIPLFLFGQSKGPLYYAQAEEIELDLNLIHYKVDSIMTAGIKQHAFPGAQLLVAQNNKIIFHNSYGFHTYDSIQKVNLNDIYDLASVTKIAGPLLALMKIYDQGIIDLDAPFSNYWKPWKHKKDKKNITLRELLTHQAGLEPYIVFLNEVIKNGHFKRRFLRTKKSGRFLNQVYDSIFVKNRFTKKIYRHIKRSKVRTEKKYLYSGLASLIYPEMIEYLTDEPYESYLNRHFYQPLGCETLGYNPMSKGITNIIPTEYDSVFRKTTVKGWVHDENASLFGGISGNAGLFGSATDLAKLMQMLVQKGVYNGKRYFSEVTVNEFIKVQFPENKNRRGLGFDKPLLGNDTLSLRTSYPAPEVSKSSFGHSGFTGTFVWADPDNQMIFIFLSNRVNPTRTNRNLYNLNIRPSLQQVFYKASIPKSKFINN